MKKTFTRVRDNEFCTLEVELRQKEDGFKVLSICGTAGEVMDEEAAEAQAKEYWQSFFEDNPDEIWEMDKRLDLNFGPRDAEKAAQFVVDTDGRFHGLDVVMERDGKVFACHSCGQIRETLAEFFPEVVPMFEWHLNDMHAGCVHQEALKWGRGRDVALSKDELTLVQREVLEAQALAEAEELRKKAYRELRARLVDSQRERRDLAKALKLAFTIDVDEALRDGPLHPFGDFSKRRFAQKLDVQLREHIEALVLPRPIESKVFKDSLGAPCPECGYRYGSAWLRRELPAEVIAWGEALPNGQIEFLPGTEGDDA